MYGCTNEELPPLCAPHSLTMIVCHACWECVGCGGCKGIGSLSAQKGQVTCRLPARSPSPRPGASHSSARAAASVVQVIAGRPCHPITLLCPVPHSLMQGPSYQCTTDCGRQLCSIYQNLTIGGCQYLGVGIQASYQGRRTHQSKTSPMHAGVVRQGLQRHESSGSVVIGMHPCCAAHAEQLQGGPCCRVCCALTAPPCQSQTDCNAGLLRLRSKESCRSDACELSFGAHCRLARSCLHIGRTPAISSARTLPSDALCWRSPAGRR